MRQGYYSEPSPCFRFASPPEVVPARELFRRIVGFMRFKQVHPDEQLLTCLYLIDVPLELQFEKLAAVASVSRCSLYPVDVRGLTTEPPAASPTLAPG